MAIIGTLPNNIQNGQLADAVPVMADFNFIVNQVNANASPLGTLDAPSGTRLVFNQAAAPLGWTQDVSATFNDAALRFVNTAGGGTGGSTPLSNWISGGTFNVNTFTLSVAQMPSHNHAANVTDPGHFHNITAVSPNTANSGNNVTGIPSSGGNMSTDSATTGISVSIQSNGSGAGITPSYTTPSVKYTNCIIGVKT
jgi:hypothetical protein